MERQRHPGSARRHAKLSRISLPLNPGYTRNMTISATAVRFDEHTMWVDLTDGRTLGVPLAWFLRLLHATALERECVEISRVDIRKSVLRGTFAHAAALVRATYGTAASAGVGAGVTTVRMASAASS
jgi:hypothetical protein